ncbi:hypothetical protein ACJMK2_027347, partial [Sinanodonta woodiana]
RPLMVSTYSCNRFIKGGNEFHFDPGFNKVTSLNWTNTSITDLQEDQTEHRLPNGAYIITVTKPPPGDYIYRIYSKN